MPSLTIAETVGPDGHAVSFIEEYELMVLIKTNSLASILPMK